MVTGPLDKDPSQLEKKSSFKVNLINSQDKYRLPRTRIKNILEKVLRELDIEKEVSFCFVDNPTMREFNKRFCKKDLPTDVLSFEYQDPYYLGDVMISVDMAKDNFRRYKTSFFEELILYAVHGVLHLCGYDDSTPSKRRKMQRTQRRLIKKCLS